MATTQQEFKDAAKELFVEFADFLVSREFVKAGDYNPVTGTTTGDIIETVDSLCEEYSQGEIDGQLIQSNDYKVLALVEDFTLIQPKTDDIKLTIGGKRANIVRVSVDAANAIYTMQVRG